MSNTETTNLNINNMPNNPIDVTNAPINVTNKPIDVTIAPKILDNSTTLATTQVNLTDTKEKEKEKEKDIDIKTLLNSIKGFLITIFLIIIVILIIFLNGSILLYFCKISQSNILPTQENCYPYTEVLPKVNEIEINVNTKNINGENYSEKIIFDYNENKEDTILNMIRKSNENPYKSKLGMFINDIFEKLFLFNYRTNDYLYNKINETFSESVIIFIMPFITSIIWFFLTTINWFVFTYYWFTSLHWMFKRNINNDRNKLPNWGGVSFLQPVNLGFSFLFTFWLIVLYFVILPIIPIAVLFVRIIIFLKMFFVKGNKNNNKYTIFSFIKDILKYNLSSIMYLLSIIIIIISFVSFGALIGIISIIICILFYFNVIPIPIYKNIIPENLTKESSYKQAEKICSNMLSNTESILSSLTLGILKGGGGKSTEEFDKMINNVNKILVK